MNATVRTRARTPKIAYESEAFPPSRGLTHRDFQAVSWEDMVWAALTVGRPNIQSVFQHGTSSLYEAIFRIALIRMALEQNGPAAQRFLRTNAFKRLDPTEKGFVSYFVGMVLCKVFAAEKLDTPWLLHLDLFRDQLSARTLAGRSRPDLIGQETLSGAWHAFESKGRASAPGTAEKRKAKLQAQRLVSVDGTRCLLHIGAISYFSADVLRFYWRDPEPSEDSKASSIDLHMPKGVWRHYYQPTFELLGHRALAGLTDQKTPAEAPIDEMDLSVLIHPTIAKLLADQAWDKAHCAAKELRGQFKEQGYRSDGLIVKCGESWRKPLSDVQRTQ